MDRDKTFKERLVLALRTIGVKQSTFCDAIGVSRSYISSMRKGMDTDKLAVVVEKFPQLNIVWLLSGKGEMLNRDMPTLLNFENEAFEATASLKDEQLDDSRAEMLVRLNDMYKEHQAMLIGAQQIFKKIVEMNINLSKTV